MIISKSHFGEPIHENRLIRNRVVRVLHRMIRHGTTRSLARGPFESHVVSTFRRHLRVLLHLSDNLKLSHPILVKQHKCIYIKHRSLMITATHCVLKGENIRDADVASDLPRVTLYSPHRPKMNDILVFENLKTDRLMSLVRRLVIFNLITKL